jgi:hypothetical protein
LGADEREFSIFDSKSQLILDVWMKGGQIERMELFSRKSEIAKNGAIELRRGRGKCLCNYRKPFDMIFERTKTGEWWAWVDLNHRPRPYQGRALAT